MHKASNVSLPAQVPDCHPYLFSARFNPRPSYAIPFFCFFVTRQDADPRIKVEYVWYCYAVRKCHHIHDSEKLVTYACAAQKTNDI